MPSEDGVWSEQGSDLSKGLSTQPLAFDGQQATLGIIKINAFFAELLLEDLVFGLQIFNGFLLAAINPSSQTDQENVPGT